MTYGTTGLQSARADEGALVDFPTRLRVQIETWKTRLAETDWTPWLIVGFAALLRFFLLGIKPPHFDEGINGWFVDQMMKNGFYRYDPTNYHGPLHFYVLLLSQTLFGRNLWALRLPVVLVSISCVWLALKFEPLVGRDVSRIAALAMAISPGFVFYGRYSIHEVWLVLFSMLFILGLLGLWKFGTSNYLWCAGMGLTGMILTKETYLIHVGCAAAAVGVCYVSNALNRVPDARPAKQTWDYVDLGFVIATGAAAIVFFYSGIFFHWSGVKGLYQAYAAWFETGSTGHGHEKPWYYWLKLIGRYEWPALVGLVLCLFCQRLKNINLRYLAIYGVGTLIAYSIVKYKTPWCIISFIWPFLFIFGAALLAIPSNYTKITQRVSAILLCASLGSAVWLNYFRCTTYTQDDWDKTESVAENIAHFFTTEPYVYVQTYNDIFKLTRPVLELAKRNPTYYQMVGHIIRPSAYPLPWILDDFPHIGYYEQQNLPTTLDADFLLVQQDRIEEVEKKLQNSYFAEPLTIRPYQDTSKLYLSAERFKSIFPGRKPNFIGKGSD
jgi:uncharacterized protein (TIGR03663 family)